MTMTAYHQTSRFFSQLSCLLMTFLVSAALIIPLRVSAAENQPPGSDMKEHREMKKIPPRQFVINVEKKGKYNISVHFSGHDDINWTPYPEEEEKRFKAEQALYETIHNDVKGQILIYELDKSRFFYEIKIPPAEDTLYRSGMHIIDKYEITEGVAKFEITRPGHYVIIPEIYSRSDELTDYTLFFSRVYRTK
ncbi:hypothetical protein ODH40_002969 [Salmonella enterica subsp. enterica]|nr:hypothetical protein [Salmonella enterica subsp. enterica serovar Lexington]ELA5064487.1 hypothetical protein [Salmonella enterica subsp. enterica]